MAVQSSQQLSMDAATQGGFIKFFKALPEKLPTTVRIFDRHEYYTVHGEDAIFTANEVFRTNSAIKNIGKGNDQLPSVILSKANFESFVRDLLLVKQYRIEVYCCKVKSSNDWKVTYKASPGNLQQLEDILFGTLDMANSLTIMSLKLATENGQRVLGLAYADQSSDVLGVTEFVENDQFSNLQALIVQLHPKECLVVSHDSSSDSRRLVQTLERSGVLVSERKRTEFSSADIVQDLDRLLSLQSGETASSLAQVDLKHAMSSLAAIIKYLELLSDESNFGSYKLTTFDFAQYLRLDNAAVRALNLEPLPGEHQSSTTHLSGVLNHCCSSQGQRLLLQWLRQPLLDKNKIEERLDLVEIFCSDLSLRLSLQDCLKAVPDLFRLARKWHKGKGSLQDCVRVYQSVYKLPTMLKALNAHQSSKFQLLKDILIVPLEELNDDFSKYIEMVEATIDLAVKENHEYIIKSSFDEQLTDLKEQMNKLESKINVQLKKASKELNLEVHKAIKLEFSSQFGYLFRITKKSEKCLRVHKQYRIVEAHKDGVRFTTSVADGLNEEYLSLKREYSSTQATLVDNVLHIAAGYAEPMLTLNHLLAQLDVLLSFAHASSCAPIPYVRPTITAKGEGDLVLKDSRHPCMEMQDDVSFIANDVLLLRNKENFQIITGPNMGGKSTYMRQIGVVVLMAQIGCFVPCSSASVCIIDSILARVGAGDSQLKGVSTFMAEMLETALILKSATKDSLVIIDELGRGTSTYDGFGLAWAISEHIATKIKCFCLFATHFHELTLLADEVSSVKNLHVTALTSDNTLTLLYKVKPGVCDQSFGIHVAELAHFPAHVIEFAKKKVKELEVNQIKVADCEVPAAKRTKSDVDEGERLIAEFLTSVRELAASNIDDKEMEAKLEVLKQQLLSADNMYIKSILQQ